MADNVPPRDAFSDRFSTIPDCAAILKQGFTQDQCQSLQQLFLIQQSYFFGLFYEMETHLELTLEEMKRKLVRTESQNTKLFLIAETARDGLISLSRRLDEIDSDRCRKHKRTCMASQECEHQTKKTMNSSSSICSDTSTLLGGTPSDASNKFSASALEALLAPIDLRLKCDSNSSGTNNRSSPKIMQDFASAPTVSGTLTPVKQWTVPGLDCNNSRPESVSTRTILRDADPALSAPSGTHDAPQSDIQPCQELKSNSKQGTEPKPERYQSHPQFPSLSSDDMGFTANKKVRPFGGVEEDEEEDEAVIVNQLVRITPSSISSSQTPLSTPKPGIDYSAAPTPLASSFTQLPSLLPTSDLPLPLLSSSTTQSQPHISDPSPPRNEVAEVAEPTPIKAKSEDQEPAPLNLAPEEVESNYLDLTRSLSPLSELTDTASNSSVVDTAVKRDNSEPCSAFRGTVTPASGLDDDMSSNVLTKAMVMRMRLEEKQRALKSKKQVMAIEKKKQGRKRLDKRAEAKREIIEQKKKSLKDTDKSSGKKREQKQKVQWPQANSDDGENVFYRQLIQCDSCNCWYHYGCAGIEPNDVRLNSSEKFWCPICTTLGKNKLKGRSRCSRPDCKQAEQPGEYFISRIAGRKLRYDKDGNVRFCYLVKWDGYPVHLGTWELEDVMPDPQKLIAEFNEACRREGLSLDSTEPILLQEAVAGQWPGVLSVTDPPGKRVPLEDDVRNQTGGHRILMPASASTSQ